MSRLLNFRFSKVFKWMLSHCPALTVLIAVSSIVPALGQGAEIFKCPENTYTFKGIPEQTLCEQYPNFNCAIQIGTGTQYPKSSLLGASVSGNVCIIANFEVDEPFSFVNATVKINPGVTIAIKPSPNGYDLGSSLAIDNSKLFACNGLWKGITLGQLSTIGTTNGTVIEDAEKAIYASAFCGLNIQQTTFNRNRIGLELNTPFPNIFVPGPLVWVFTNNRFTCDAPLNGTTNEITESGVKLKNSYLYTFQSGLNRFSDLKYGIYSDGDFSHIGASNLYMQRIKKDGIYMAEGSINLADSWFYTCEEKGINIERAKLVNVKNAQFTMSTAPSSNYQNGIYINKFAINADVQLNDINFSADMEGTTNTVRGIHLKGGNVGAGTKIQVKGNSVTGSSVFALRAKDSQGIYLEGDFPSSSTTEIWGNRFRVSNTTQNQGSGQPSGIETLNNKNNLSIKWNTFTSFTVHTLLPGQAGSPQWNYGAYLRYSPFGANNEVSVNSFNYEVQPMLFFLLASDFQNTKYCSNTFSGYGFSTGAYFQGTCTGTEFVGNIFNFAGSESLLIGENTQIGIKSHRGNEWHNLFGIEPAYHARCQGDPSINKFIVHTAQSTCANENAPCFNPFHPRKIEPDDMNEFFDIDPTGTPSQGCNNEFTAGGTDELDWRIAQGTFTSPSDNPAMDWVLQRYLYQKLKNNPALISDHAALPVFISSKENTTVGKFYDVHTAIENALKSDVNVDASNAQALSDISALLESMTEVDEAIEQQGLTEILKTQKKDLFLKIHGQHWVYDSLRNVHEAQVVLNLQTAYNLNQAIVTTQAYEINEKTINRIHLLSLIEQGGEFTENQVVVLQSIAQQDPKQGGPAVHTALGMLPECAKPQILYDELNKPNSRDVEYAQMIENWNATGVIQEASGISVSPNPTGPSFTLRNPRGNPGMLTMFDISGRICIQQSFSGQESRVDLKAGIPSGIYLLRFDMEDGASVFKKLAVQPN